MKIKSGVKLNQRQRIDQNTQADSLNENSCEHRIAAYR